ncbi:MAG: hypothetical protein JOZ81_05760, partial [Chloroflexi bacterium]|nr:hypothetical protein [Chloroflexota bacterium]
ERRPNVEHAVKLLEGAGGADSAEEGERLVNEGLAALREAEKFEDELDAYRQELGFGPCPEEGGAPLLERVLGRRKFSEAVAASSEPQLERGQRARTHQVGDHGYDAVGMSAHDAPDHADEHVTRDELEQLIARYDGSEQSKKVIQRHADRLGIPRSDLPAHLREGSLREALGAGDPQVPSRVHLPAVASNNETSTRYRKHLMERAGLALLQRMGIDRRNVQ